MRLCSYPIPIVRSKLRCVNQIYLVLLWPIVQQWFQVSCLAHPLPLHWGTRFHVLKAVICPWGPIWDQYLESPATVTIHQVISNHVFFFFLFSQDLIHHTLWTLYRSITWGLIKMQIPRISTFILRECLRCCVCTFKSEKHCST